MDHDFLSIKHASQQYVVSDVTLRRLAREITRDDTHELRELIRPGGAELKQLKEEKKPFEYELSTKLLDLRFKERDASEEEGSGSDVETNDATEKGSGVSGEIFEVFREQLKVKDDQIKQLNESLAMQQQQNGTNMLLVRLSERLPLLNEPAQEGNIATTVDAETTEDDAATKTATQRKSTGKKKGRVKKKIQPEKKSRGVFDRWFRREPAKVDATR